MGFSHTVVVMLMFAGFCLYVVRVIGKLQLQIDHLDAEVTGLWHRVGDESNEKV